MSPLRHQHLTSVVRNGITAPGHFPDSQLISAQPVQFPSAGDAVANCQLCQLLLGSGRQLRLPCLFSLQSVNQDLHDSCYCHARAFHSFQRALIAAGAEQKK